MNRLVGSLKMRVLNIKKFSLQTKFTVLVSVVVLISLSITAYMIGSNAIKESKEFQAEKVMDIATTISHTKLVIDGLSGDEPADAIQKFTKQVQEDTNVQYIVVMDNNHIRHSHPNPERVGQYFVGDDEDRAFNGDRYTSLAQGTLGESLRAFVPIYATGEQIGVVSVGILSETVRTAVLQSLRTSYTGVAIGLFVGLLGAILLAKQVKRTLFGLEPAQIAKLLHEREAVLESVREGIVAVNEKGEIIVANQAAIHLFYQAGLVKNPIGEQVENYLPGAYFKEVFQNGESKFDEEVKVNGIDIVMNQVPVVIQDEVVGALATFRDKSELTSLVEQLSGAKAFAETLRVQTHEFMNKLHVITAMVHTKSYDELKKYTSHLSESYQKEVGAVSRLVKDPVIAGYLLSKLSEARELGVQVELIGDEPLPRLQNMEQMDSMITILGNLFDNAIDAVEQQQNALITITLDYRNKFLAIEIKDNGPGFMMEAFDEKELKGQSSKGENHGYGLYLVRKALKKLNGELEVFSIKGEGAKFHVFIPYEGALDD